jgi:hypothetical protein
VSTISKETFDKLPDFKKRVTWFENYRKRNNLFWPNEERGDGEKVLLSLVPKERLVLLSLLQSACCMKKSFYQAAVSGLYLRYHKANPYTVTIDGETYTIQYDPGDSTSNLFGGNSNWRGPVWMPHQLPNYPFCAVKYGEFYGDQVKVECPAGSGNMMNLVEVSAFLSHRVVSLFKRDEQGNRKLFGEYNWFFNKPGNEDLILFYEYFHGDTGSGLGASHQTGWTSLVADLIGRGSGG